MLTVNASQIELMQKIARRIDRKLSFQLHHLADGSIEVKLAIIAISASIMSCDSGVN
jgi:cell division protein ZapA (FtsZ GTPase activity inhibitor)